MLLRINFEELQALHYGVELIVDSASVRSEGGVATAPSPRIVELDELRGRLNGDLSVITLAEQGRLRDNIEMVCARLKERMDQFVTEYHPAHEDAVAAYFAYGYARAVLLRLDEMGEEMRALIQVMEGRPADDRDEESFQFPD